MSLKRTIGVVATVALGAVAGLMVLGPVGSRLAATVHAEGDRDRDRDDDDRAPKPSAVGNWFGIARPCPVTPGDEGHADFCTAICPTCTGGGPLPPEVPMMPMIHGDGTVTVNDAASIKVFHTTAQGVWAPDPDPSSYQIHGRTRLQASFIWLDGTPDHRFDGVVRPRFVTYWDPTNPDNMIGYIQPYFFPTNGWPFPPPAPPGLPLLGDHMLVIPAPNHRGNLDVTNHYPAVNFLGKLPKTCSPDVGCLGTYHFTIARQKANVPN